MTIQQALTDYPYISRKIQDLNRSINEILMVKHDTSVTAKLTGMPGGGEISDPTGQAVERIVDRYDVRITKLGERIDALFEAKDMVDSRLDRLNIQERRVIEYRYFRLMQWSEIQQAMNYSERTVYRIHRDALKAMEDGSKRQDMTVQCKLEV